MPNPFLTPQQITAAMLAAFGNNAQAAKNMAAAYGGLFNPLQNVAQQYAAGKLHIAFAVPRLGGSKSIEEARARLVWMLKRKQDYIRLEDMTPNEAARLSMDEYWERRSRGEGT